MLRGLTTIALAVVLLLGAAVGADADTPAPYEAGKSCVADAAATNLTTIGFDPARVYPAGLSEIPNWVVTHWKVQIAPGLGPLAQRLVTSQGVSENEDRKTGESALETLSEGTNEFPARLPVTGLHPHVGLQGPVETLYCGAEPEMLAGEVEGQWGAGETRHYKIQVGIGSPVAVTIEPDRDGDGYGDLTQDRCPWGWSFGSDCPIALKIPHASVKLHAILIEASPSADASLEVTGQVSWRPQAKHGGDVRRTVIVGLSAGGAVGVAGGTSSTFRLPLPASVVRRLGRLGPSRSLVARLTIRITDGGGSVTETARTVKLRGRLPAGRGR